MAEDFLVWRGGLQDGYSTLQDKPKATIRPEVSDQGPGVALTFVVTSGQGHSYLRVQLTTDKFQRLRSAMDLAEEIDAIFKSGTPARRMTIRARIEEWEAENL